MTKVAVLLSGSGNRDGSEIHEASICMTSLELLDPNLTLECTSIDTDQAEVLNFITGRQLPERRNTLVESARIARGAITPVGKLDTRSLDGLVIIGGLGAVKNLSTFYKDKEQMRVNKDVENLVMDMHRQKKPIGAICIAPIILARLFASLSPIITLGSSPSEASRIATLWGARVVEASSGSIVVDEKNKFVTTPAFMNEGSLRDIQPGIYKLAQKILNF